MTNDDITGLLLAIPEISAWPQMATILTRTAGKVRMDWLLPVFGCQAVGGAEPDALPGVAAMACSQISIILADDLLDEDPRGEHHRIGVGQAANLALAFQAAAFRVIDQAPISAAQRAAVQGRLAFLALKTAYGQWLDVQNLSGEDDYWKVVEAKSTPFYGVALQVGALLGGAGAELAAEIYAIGVQLGEIVQLFDDLEDALQVPASPDWTQGRNNLLILYARVAPHEQRDAFVTLLSRLAEPGVLPQAQQILIDSGAVSYAIYQAVTRFQAAQQRLANLDLANPEPIRRALIDQMAPLKTLFQQIGLEAPPELNI